VNAALQYALCCIAACAVAAFSPGCRRDSTAPLGSRPPVKSGPVVTLPDGGMSHTEPLARLAWDGPRLRACGGRRLDRGGPAPAPIDRAARCLVASPGPSGDGGAAPEAVASDHFVDGGGDPPAPCRVFYEDIPGDPGAPPARATLFGPKERQPLDAWAVPREVDGDYFAVEIAFSPDGKWMGVVHTSVGIGDGERLVRVVEVRVVPAPACR
jgi:hypothetical protein